MLKDVASDVPVVLALLPPEHAHVFLQSASSRKCSAGNALELLRRTWPRSAVNGRRTRVRATHINMCTRVLRHAGGRAMAEGQCSTSHRAALSVTMWAPLWGAAHRMLRPQMVVLRRLPEHDLLTHMCTASLCPAAAGLAEAKACMQSAVTGGNHLTYRRMTAHRGGFDATVVRHIKPRAPPNELASSNVSQARKFEAVTMICTPCAPAPCAHVTRARSRALLCDAPRSCPGR